MTSLDTVALCSDPVVMRDHLSRRQFLAASTALPLAARPRAQRPNIIFILADDLGYGDLGCFGQRQGLRTPNIDALADEGRKFTQSYAGSTVCAPSRCCLMTGRHSGHCRVRGNLRPEASVLPEEVTVAEVLKSAGYRTGLFGKWGLGGPGQAGGLPNDQGFEEFFGYLDQLHAHDFYPKHLWHNRQEIFLPENRASARQIYSHDLIAGKALEFLDETPAGQPFFLYLPFTIPHANNERGHTTGDGMEVPDYGSFADRDWPAPEKGFAAMIERMDRDIGRVMKALKDSGRDENTLVIFSSDNGPHREGGHDPEFFRSRGPLRGIKRDLYEGGIRVPTIARWSGQIEAGSTSHQVWAFWDVLPTFAELAGVKPPKKLDGISMVPALLGGKQRDHEYLYWEFHERGFDQAVRMRDWKGVLRSATGGGLELYHLTDDIGEERDIAADNPDVVEMIEEIIAEARTETELFPVER